jgi:hypothetical protein
MRGGSWMKRKERVLRAYEYRCQGEGCGAIDRPLQVHHKDGCVRNNAFANLIPLCAQRHARANIRRPLG